MRLFQRQKLFFFIAMTVAFLQTAKGQNAVDSLTLSYQHKLAAAGGYSDSISIMLNFSEELVNSKPFQGKEIALEAMQMLRATQDAKRIVRALYVASANYLNLGAIDSAMNYLNEARMLISKSKDSSYYVSVCNQLGRAFFQSNSYDSAIYYYNEMLSVARRLDDPLLKAAAQNNLGMVYSELGKLKEAYLAYLEALKYYEATDDFTNQAVTLNNIAIINYDLKQFRECIEYNQKAIAINEKLGNKFNLSMNYGNMGASYKELKEFDNAEVALKKSLEIASEGKILRDVARAQMNLANLYKHMLQFKRAEQYYLASLETCKRENLDYGVMLNNINLGELYLRMGNEVKGRNYLLAALDLATEMQQLKMIEVIYEKLTEAYETKGDFKQALAYFKLHIAIKDSLQDMSNKQFINDLQTKYNTQKREAENNYLKKENENNIRIIRNQRTTNLAVGAGLVLALILVLVIYRSHKRMKDINTRLQQLNDQFVLQNKQLQETNATKDKLFSLIAHDLRSPFNSMMGLLKFLIDEFDTIDEEERNKIFNSLYLQTTNTYGLLENLLQWAMSQGGRMKFNPELLNLNILVEEEISFLKSRLEKKHIELKLQLPEKLIVWGDKTMIRTIIRNIINNAIKFTPSGGQINLTAIAGEGIFTLCIQDSGIGMSQQAVEAILKKSEFTSTLGTDNEKGTGLGLAIVKDFIAMNRASLRIESDLGKGSKFCVDFRQNNNDV